MQINLTQSEIVVALKNYISQQGINLYGKEVSITFTAGRKESGISAAMDIEDTDLPQFGEAEPATLELVRSIPTELLVQASSITVVQDNTAGRKLNINEDNTLSGVVPVDSEPVEEAEPAPKTTSLFG